MKMTAQAYQMLRICAIEKMKKAVAFIFLNGLFLDFCKYYRNWEGGLGMRVFIS
jgi:hypothetical protein